MTDHTFAASGPVHVRATIRASDLIIIAADTTQVRVDLQPHRDNNAGHHYAEETQVRMRGDTLDIEVPRGTGALFGSTPRLRITVHVPTGSHLDIASGSGDVQAQGDLGHVRVRTGSGDVTAQSAATVTVAAGSGNTQVQALTDGDFTSGSGNVHVGRADGQVRAKSGSGDLLIDHAADVVSTGASGDTSIGRFAGTAQIRSASGDVSVREAVRGQINAVSASGHITIGVRPGTAVLLDCSSTSGRTESDLGTSDAPQAQDDALELRARAVSGNVRVTHSAAGTQQAGQG